LGEKNLGQSSQAPENSETEKEGGEDAIEKGEGWSITRSRKRKKNSRKGGGRKVRVKEGRRFNNHLVRKTPGKKVVHRWLIKDEADKKSNGTVENSRESTSVEIGGPHQ